MLEAIPNHVAIIMDGNGRWAKNRGNLRSFGHKEGAKRVFEIVEYASDIGIKYLTLYAFSTENWKRPKTEVDYLMKLISIFIESKINSLHENNVRLRIFGDINKLPKQAYNSCVNALKKTEMNDGLNLNIAINYGSRSEIARAVKKMMDDGLKSPDINDDLISSYLYSKEMPDPELLIRTGGEKRVSNFLLYQLAYSELYFTDVLWPDFDKYQFQKALDEYQSRDRRFGAIK